MYIIIMLLCESVYYGIIKINLNNIDNYIPKESNQTLHNYNFEEAIKYENRSIYKYLYLFNIKTNCFSYIFPKKSFRIIITAYLPFYFHVFNRFGIKCITLFK